MEIPGDMAQRDTVECDTIGWFYMILGKTYPNLDWIYIDTDYGKQEARKSISPRASFLFTHPVQPKDSAGCGVGFLQYSEHSYFLVTSTYLNLF